MTVRPTFIMSLDCEGKWGMADELRPFHHRDITGDNLKKAYRQLLDMLGRHDIRATFAFVMAFTLREEERGQFDLLEERKNPGDSWLRYYWDSMKSGQGDGWHCPEAFEMVRNAGTHEIASHSFCHRPLDDESIDAAGAAEELAHAGKAAKLKQVEFKTLVFPRNHVGNLPAVRAAGYRGYRSQLRPRGVRVGALLEEFVTWRQPQRPPSSGDALVAIPAGHFFNWRFGLRKLVPPAVTIARWHNQLEACGRHGGVVHLWLHPHNLITGPDTAPVLDRVLGEVARLRDAGRIQVLTQDGYCEHLARAKTVA
jgi:peptidoglycan/xylan/chitin deacetylase (PgdA/CDA1 family)